MPEITEHVAYLSQQIGPRPAGTEEEQQAALYITEQFQKDAGLSAVIEDFSGVSNADIPRAICCGATFVCTLVALVFPAFGFPAAILALIAALLFAAEVFDRPVLSRFFARGVSQNVVAKYEPGYTTDNSGSRRRKVVLVAHYDTGKVRAELKQPFLKLMPIMSWAIFGAAVFLPLWTILHIVAFPQATGAVALIYLILTVIGMVLVALPLIVLILHKVAAFNEGANCNASGTAVLLEVARRIGRGRVSEADLAARSDAVVHGEEAAWESGVVPDGAQLIYEAAPVKAPVMAPQTAESRLASAKAAIASLSGKPVSGVSAADIAENLVQIKEPPIGVPSADDYREQRGEAREAFTTIPADTMQAALENAKKAAGAVETVVVDGVPIQMMEGAVSGAVAAAAAVSAGAPAAAGASSGTSGAGVPDWFKKAQEKAKKPKQDKKPAQRSRYASALDAAVAESAGHFMEANEAVAQEMASTQRAHQDEIREVAAPSWARPDDDFAEMSFSAAVAAAARADEANQFGRMPAGGTSRAAAPASTESSAASTAPDGALLGDDEAIFGVEEPSVAMQVASAAQGAEAPQGSMVTQGAAAPQSAGAVGVGVQPGPSLGNEVVDPFSTRAMAPLDVSDLRAGTVPPLNDVPMPAFLNPLNAQKEAQEALLNEGPRTENRVAVDAREDAAPVAAPAAAFDLPVVGIEDEEKDAASPRPAHRPIVLPDIAGSAALPPIGDIAKQRAPLAEAQTAGGKTAAKSLLTMLPSIDLGAQGANAAAVDAPRNEPTSTASSLRASLPSLSGAITRQEPDANSSTNISLTGAFVPAGATGTFAPIGNELIENVAPEDIYVDDADDSSYEENYTETGAFAGPGYVDMPKSRAHRFFGKFRKKKKDEVEATPQEWLEVDEQFDARTVGAQRGGWESFREEGAAGSPLQAADGAYGKDPLNHQALYADEAYEEYDEYDDYNGYAAQGGNLVAATQAFPFDADASFDDRFDVDDVDDDRPAHGRPWQGGAFSRLQVGRADITSEALDEEEHTIDAAPFVDIDPHENVQQIYQFRNPDINTEVWFVALGAELSNHHGMQAFLNEHQQELRGAIIVDMGAMGAGDVCMIEREGRYRKAKTSSRMKRYVKKASQATGLSVGTAQLLWEDSAASYAIKHGAQAMHIAGMGDGKPAYFAQADDVMENIEEGTLVENANFIMELLKNI